MLIGGLMSEHQDPPANIEIDTEALGAAATKFRKIEEAQPLSKRKLKQAQGKKSRTNRGKRRGK
jgi:hypothetical protein